MVNYPPTWISLRIQVRIICDSVAVTGNIHFTSLGSSIPFSLGAYETYTYSLTPSQIEAVYNFETGISNNSLYITSSDLISVYAYSGLDYGHGDVTNILPATTLGTDYYQITHWSYLIGLEAIIYTVVATQNDTQVFQNGVLKDTINEGQVYHLITNEDLTGAHITSNYPVAFFSLNSCIAFPAPCGRGDQQFPPINNWGKNFFVPNTPHSTSDRVRIVVTKNNTTIILTGGTLQTVPGAQTNPTNLQAGQFVEIKISPTGCYIESDEPIGVCSFIDTDHQLATPSLCWIPALEQKISHALIAPFIFNGTTQINSHYAVVCTHYNTKDDTRVSIGGDIPIELSGGNWIDHLESNMSFYAMPLLNITASYYFSNPAGFIILGYGGGVGASYCYPSGFATRNLSATFTANDIHYENLQDTIFCAKDVYFKTEIMGELHSAPGSLRWYIDEIEHIPARDLLEWYKPFENGEYEIKMVALFENGETTTLVGILKIEVFWMKMRNVRY